jgi:hypothetical protein
VTLPKFTGELLPEHLALVEQVQARRMQIGLSTERADRPAVEGAVTAAYTAAGLDPPALFVWMDSPLGGLFAAAVIKDALTNKGQLGDQLWDQLRGQLRDQLRGQLRDQLRGQLRDQLRGQLRGQLGDQLWGQLGDQLWDQLRGQLWGQLRGQLRDQLRDQLGDQLDPWYDGYWLAFYQCALEIAGLPASDRLSAIDEATSAGWWWPMAGIAVLTDRPTVINRDPQARLHCETGPALAYADGYTMHCWHGIRTEEWVITDPSPERILRETNVEVRRCAIESLCWPEFIAAAGLSPVGSDAPDPGNPGQTLALYDVPEEIYETPIRVLIASNGSVERDGTRHTFGLTVPAEIKDPIAAAAWGYGLSRKQYLTAQVRR